jgi:mannose PTS system EIID component
MTAIPATVRARMLLRSFAVQGSWNYETLIGAGFAFTLLPALRYIHGREGRRLDEAVARHCELFNSHPYVATVAAGAVSRLEADGVQPIVLRRFKAALRGSLGSMGDRLVWTAWRPMAAVLGIVLLLAGASWWLAIAIFLVVYNALHLTLRVLGMRMGSEAGLEVGRALREFPLQPMIDLASRVAAFLTGVAIVLAAAPTVREPFVSAMPLLAVGLGIWLGHRCRRLVIASLVGVAAVGLLIGLIGNGA